MSKQSKTYHIITYGCQMNYSDSARIAAVLEGSGLTCCDDPTQADLVVINSCSVRQMAEDRTHGQINKLSKLSPRPKIIATGCLVSQKIVKKMLQAGKLDLHLPIKDIVKLPQYLKDWNLYSKRATDTYEHYLQIIPKPDKEFSAFLPIMTGCNNFCTYCAVPYTRGREVSRPIADVVKEAELLAKKGCLQITLLGQNVNSYGSDWSLDKKPHFVELLEKVANIKGLQRIYFISSHPKDMSEDLLKVISKYDNLCKYIHLPLQAGDNQVLKNMNRHYTGEDYFKLVEKIKKYLPSAAISTDIIVGFPGETKTQFLKSAEVFKHVQFDMAFISEYSPRPQSVAFQIKDNVTHQEKVRRKYVLNELLTESSLVKNTQLLNTIQPILVTQSKKDNILIGYTEGLKQVHFSGSTSLIGKIIKVKIIKSFPWGMKGEVIK